MLRSSSAPASRSAPGSRSLLSLTVVTALAATSVAVISSAYADASALIAPVKAVPDVMDPSWVLSTTDPTKNYAPAFVGNGYLGARVPPHGAGYGRQEGDESRNLTKVASQFSLAGFYGNEEKKGNWTEVRAGLPSWTGLDFGDGADSIEKSIAKTLKPITSKYRQALDLKSGTITTSYTWTSPSGKSADVVYKVRTDRSQPHVGMVTLSVTPRWTGSATFTDLFDPRSLTGWLAPSTSLAVDTAKGVLTETLKARETNLTATITSILRVGNGGPTTTKRAAAPTRGQSATLSVAAGKTYTATKFVGIAASQDTDRTVRKGDDGQYALAQANAAAELGADKVAERSAQEWSRLWAADISVPNNVGLTTQLRASLFYLLSSVRSNVFWSTTPGGLSAGGYNGHVFWDMEIWKYPALLAQHPDIARAVNEYRQRLLGQAKKNASTCAPPGQTIKGARFPWESGLTGIDGLVKTDQKDFEERCHEIHIGADITLAHWQYYQATRDTAWLKNEAWPVLQGIADYYATRAVKKGNGYQILDVVGPDEFNPNVNNNGYTNAAAQKALRIAAQAATITGNTASPLWATVANGLTIPFNKADQVHRQYDNYPGKKIKQADVTLLQYPLEFPMSPTVAQNNMDYYGPRTTPNGPAMTDAIAAINSAALTSTRCDSFTYMQRSINPFMRAPFQQFAEQRNGGAFAFITGAGGFLQEFQYGFTGLRWDEKALRLDPSLPPQIPGVDLTGMQWQGRTFDISIRPKGTTVTVTKGDDMPVVVAGRNAQVAKKSQPLTITTRVPHGSADAARCKPVTASSQDPSYSAAAAVDGNDTTLWRATKAGAQLTVDLGSPTPMESVQVLSGAAATTAYTIEGSTGDGAPFKKLGEGKASTGKSTSVTFPKANYRYIRYQANAAATPEVANIAVVPAGGAIRQKGATNSCLENVGGKGRKGDLARVATCNNTPAQKWSRYPDGTVRVLGKCLDVQFGAQTANSKVWLYDCKGEEAQKWQVQSNERLFNPRSGKCLDFPGTVNSNTQLIISNCNSTAAGQKWNIS